MQATNQQIDAIILEAIKKTPSRHVTLKAALERAGIEFKPSRHISEPISWLASEAANRSCQRLRKAGKINITKSLWKIA